MSPDIGKGQGVYISTYGCQMNVNDTERMYSLLEMLNFTPVETPEQAKLILINSCSVREKPVHKVHSEVGRYRILKQADPEIRIGVAGCVAQQEKEKLMKDVPLIDFVFGTDAIDSLPEIISQVYSGQKRVVSTRFEHQKPYSVETMIRNPGVSAFVNIMKGCDNFCTFCVVPFTRGRERSRDWIEVRDDVRRLFRRGVREVTLLGQNVNSYKSSCGADFAALLRGLVEETPIERIRYTTSHPKDFNQELVDVHRIYRSRICDYIHLPVQSGSSEVLHRMNRGYTREQYLEKVQMIREGIPGVVLSTDIIVGFPGETEEQFQETLSLIREVRYDNIYPFQYSPRPLTKAARYTDQVPDDVKSRRLSELIEVQKEISFELAKEYNGRCVDVLLESFREEDKQWVGRSSQNKLVYIEEKKDQILSDVSAAQQVPTSPSLGLTFPVQITRAFPNVLYGKWLSI